MCVRSERKRELRYDSFALYFKLFQFCWTRVGVHNLRARAINWTNQYYLGSNSVSLIKNYIFGKCRSQITDNTCVCPYVFWP